MVFRRKERPGEPFRVWITLPGFGRVGPWSTGFTSRRKAEQVEAWLREIALERPEVVEGILEGRYSLRSAWVARQRGEHFLDELVRGHEDPRLVDAVEAYRPHCRDPRARAGLDQLLALAPPGARLSWLRESAPAPGQKPPRNISRLYAQAIEAGQRPNTVRRGLHRAVRGLLVYELGVLEAERRMEGLRGRLPTEDDTRRVDIRPEELRRLIDAIESDRFRWMVLAAILTTADRTPLLRMRARDFDDEAGTVRIHDTKTRHRYRVVSLGEIARTVLRLATAGLDPDELVFPYTPGQVRNLWEAARDAAAGRPTRWMRAKRGRGRAAHLPPLADPVGEEAARLLEEQGIVTLPVLRFKDLRHLLPTALAALKVDRREIQAILGHAPGSRMADRYITPAGEARHLDEAAELLGIGRAHLGLVG